ncbi:MAG: TIGR01620 family protein [Pseudomonadota bacterium]
MSDEKSTGPVIIELDDTFPPAPSPADAPPVPTTSQGQAMQAAARIAARPTSRLARFFWTAALAVIGFVASVSAWQFVTNLLASNPVLGWIASGLFGLLLAACLLVALREAAGFARLGRLDRLRREAEGAASTGDLTAARRVASDLGQLYAVRAELAQGCATLARRSGEIFETGPLFAVAEAEVLAPLDKAAEAEIATAARQVATVTALVPLALADIAAAMVANLRMIRRIAEIYGGRGGTLGAWRLTRAVLAHLVATGAVAVGDDLLGSVAGGSVLSKLSRRFGEGMVNGALTARVGVAALEVCRPLPFGDGRRPRVTTLVRQALAGLFDRQTSES